MLRLRPSEITLTPVDVEETRRRMARRQAALPSAGLPIRGPRPYPPLSIGPRLRPGPEHSRDDALTGLGNIPILRPHEAVHSSTDSDSDDSLPQAPEANADNSGTPVPDSSAPEEVTPTPARNMQLPFRPATQDTIPARQSQLPPPRLSSRENTEDDAPSSPPKHQFGFSGFGRARTNTSEDLAESAAHTREQSSIDGAAEASQHGAARSSVALGRGRVDSVLQRSTHAPSPLNQAHAISSPQAGETGKGNGERDSSQPQKLPTLYLHGYFLSPERYVFKESQIMPHTEPRSRPVRSPRRVRTMSSQSDPSQPARMRSLGRTAQSSADEDFWTAPTAEVHGRTEAEASENAEEHDTGKRRPSLDERLRSRAHTISESIQGRYRELFGRTRTSQTEHNHIPSNVDISRHASQGVSEASTNSSQPYSYYELPASRQSSGNHQQGSELPQAQYDGAAPSRHLSRGAYFSIRPSQVRSANDGHLRPRPTRVSSFSSPNLPAMVGHHGVSPLPASPYTRMHSAQSTPRPSTGLVSPNDFVGDDQDASSAAQRDLSSPLDLLEQRAASYLSRISSEMYTAPSQPSSRVPSAFQHEITDFDDPLPEYRRVSGSSGIRQGSGNSAHYRTSTGRRDPDLRPPHTRYSELSSTRTPTSQSQRRGAPGSRAGHRSSENVPVGTSTNEAQPVARTFPGQHDRVSQGQTQQFQHSQVASIRGGQIPSSPIPIRFSMPHASPRDLSNRQMQLPQQQSNITRSPREYARSGQPYSSSPSSPPEGRRQGLQGQGPAYAAMIPPRNSSYRQRAEPDPERRNPPRSIAGSLPYHERQTAPQTYAPRHGDRPSVAPEQFIATGSHRPSMHRAGTSRRRITPQQQNQENSGDAEEQMMREELAAAGMRYARDEQQLDTMDETPPRLGRFERHMVGN
ncbi:uncharacterized protein BDR25DRAFT_378648 [Lindgomyces ingoldianus]|uniref:Uncharacterized protein n=1 Tax=Lindgomyces ingoldianus TaxID=673940 RepID=A0ACB6QF49_9PLEO|nr:uncharacterized protein BDR25DRAFT_378648 [Lindgomyces ingoldianus]KAF2465495.1 hypothetical protein BDR25DRAFT_378648 [Lindgomyces ingoldianus]